MGSEKVTNEQIFALLQCTRNDIKDIKLDIANFKEEVQALKNTVNQLEEENIYLKQRISQQEDLLKRKNILIFGLQETDVRPLEEILLEFFNDKLQIKIKSCDLDNYYKIGEKKTTGNRPILVKFLRELTVREVFKNVKKLKGTGLSIAKDLSLEKREQNKILYDYSKIAKEKHFPAKIVKSRLIIGEDEYTVDILRNINRNTFLEPFVDKQLLFPNTSAPPTPTPTNKKSESSGSEDEAFILQEVQEIQNKETKKNKISAKPEIKSKISRNQQLSSQTPRSTRSGSTSNQQVPRNNSKVNK